MFDHPNTPLSEWRMFKEQAPRLPLSTISEVVDRSDLGLPEGFLPLARGGAFASDHLLSKAGCRPGSRWPRGWRRTHVDVFTRYAAPLTVMVRGCGGLWTVERWWDRRRCEDCDEVLVLEFGFTPIFTREPEAAMYLADHCLSHKVPDLCWVEACPFRYKAAVELAKNRRLVEARLH